jgi:hypothetical protein
LFDASLGLVCLFSWGISSFDSSYKHKGKVNKDNRLFKIK